jgi:hypothetical protein
MQLLDLARRIRRRLAARPKSRPDYTTSRIVDLDGALVQTFLNKGPDVSVQAGTYDVGVRRLFAAAVGPGSTVLDIGANAGYHSALFAHRCGPTGKVFAFEPVEYNLRKLRLLCALNRLDNIAIVPCALGAEDGRVEFIEVREEAYGHGNGGVLANDGLRKMTARAKPVPSRWTRPASMPSCAHAA